MRAASRRSPGRCMNKALALFQALGDPHGEAGVLLDLGRLSRDYFVGGAPQQHWQQTVAAKQMTLASVAIYRAMGDRANLARGLWILGSTCLVLGEADEAQRALEECLAICQALGTISTALYPGHGFFGWGQTTVRVVRADAQPRRERAGPGPGSWGYDRHRIELRSHRPRGCWRRKSTSRRRIGCSKVSTSQIARAER